MWHDRRALKAWKPKLGYLAVAGGIALIIAGPAAFQYLRLGRDPNFQRGYDSQFAMRWPDLRLPADGNRAQDNREGVHRAVQVQKSCYPPSVGGTRRNGRGQLRQRCRHGPGRRRGIGTTA